MSTSLSTDRRHERPRRAMMGRYTQSGSLHALAASSRTRPRTRRSAHMKLRIAIALLAGFAAASLPASAFAYNESGTVDPAFTTCVSCHGAVSGPPTTGTMEPLRSGPHDAFTSDSFKCATCHEVHQAVGGLL